MFGGLIMMAWLFNRAILFAGVSKTTCIFLAMPCCF